MISCGEGRLLKWRSGKKKKKKNLLAMQEIQEMHVQSLDQEDPLE